ncbi:hypothetical protein ABPG77_008204 [Micractinium sp. CCAP 211/92]
MRGKLAQRRALLAGCLSGALAYSTGACSTPRPAMAAAAQPPCPAGAARIMLTGDVMLGKPPSLPSSPLPVLPPPVHSRFLHSTSCVSARTGVSVSVMLAGRGVDQILPCHCSPELYEGWVKDARQYVQLAVAANGPLPGERGFAYPWAIALADMEARQPHVRVINLETAVTSHPRPWPHKGINYRMHPGNVPALTSAGVDVACLANNHAMDWGREGLVETLQALHGAGIQTAGAGHDLAEAHAPAVVPLPPDNAGRGGRLLVWAIGHSSSGVPSAWAAGQGQPGVFPADLSPAGVPQLAQLVAAHKREGDIALVSGGGGMHPAAGKAISGCGKRAALQRRASSGQTNVGCGSDD